MVNYREIFHRKVIGFINITSSCNMWTKNKDGEREILILPQISFLILSQPFHFDDGNLREYIPFSMDFVKLLYVRKLPNFMGSRQFT